MLLQVKYMSRVEDYLPLSIPMESATNKEEVEIYKAKKAEVCCLVLMRKRRD